MQKSVSPRSRSSRGTSQDRTEQRRKQFLSGPVREQFKMAKLSVESLESRHLMAGAFFAPPAPTGSVDVQLTPLANVAAGTQEIVTFGVPFTRGSISAAQLANVRVLKNGVEIPAFVEQLTPWRSIDDPAIDGQSVRVARIQIPYTFAALSTESITVQWGGPARTLNRATLQDPRLEWHTATSGTFVSGDNVEEPDVLPVLPKEYLAKGMLDARTDPTSNAVAPTRDDPAVTDAMTFSGYTELDYAQKNFFYTIINQNPGITVNYKTDPEPWLYDRASGMYELYLRSGFTTALREAVRAADFYADHINAQGFFTLKAGDTKYAYNESLAYTYWLMGDSKMLAPISTVVSAHSGTATRWNPNLSFWTERNVGYKLLANEVGYEVTGNTSFKNTVQTIIADLIYHQNGAGGQLPANRVDGGLYHIGEQHDASEVEDPNVLIASSWMSALIVDPMVRVFGVWQNAQISDFIVRMGNFEKVASKTDADGQLEAGSTRYPDYLMRTDGTSENRSDTDVQHALDVGGVAAWASYFAELRGTPDPSLRQLANDLYRTYDIGVNFWTRPGGTNYNVSPPRRYTWEYKNSASFSWALTSSDVPGQPGALQFSASNFTVNETQGTATITVSRSGGSTGAVSVNYATSNGTATAGSDYTTTSGVLNFGAGEITKTFVIPIINDTAVEISETVTITLSNPTGGASLASPSTATLTIESDDSTNQPTTVTVQEGVNGYSGTTDVSITNQYAQFTGGNGHTSVTDSQGGVYQIGGTDGYTIETLIRFANLGIPTNANVSAATLTLSVDSSSNNPTIRGFYVAAPWSVEAGTDLGWVHRGTGQNWNTPGALGQGTDVLAGKSFLLSGIQGTGTQFVTVNLDPAVVQNWINNPSSNNGIILVNETTGAVVRINMSEQTNATLRPKLGVTYTVGAQTPQPGSLQLSAAAYAVNENQGTATITVTRTGGSEGAVSVAYATSNGTATAGSDYTATNGVLNFAAGEVSKTFTIPIINDTAIEGLETVNITLSNPTGGATLGGQVTSTLTITSDDVATLPGSLQFSNATYAVNETNGTVTITVTRSGGSDGAVSVSYATSNGTATAGSDYTATSGTLNFAAGETSKSFTIPIINDTAVEGLETVSLTLSSPTGGATLGSQATATLTITSDDVATVPGVLQFSSATYSVNETNATVTVTVTRTGGSDGAVSVAYATSNGSATAGSDYTATSGLLNFAAGETSKSFAIPIINDTAIESPETVTLTLSNPTGGATLGGQATATLTINSDDSNGQPVTVSLQQGVSGYTGTTDVSISTQYAQYNEGNGITGFTDAQMGLYQLSGSGAYSVENLIRFSNLGIPAGATVTGATITLRVDSWVSSPTIRGYYIASPWNAVPGPNSSQLGWLHRGNGQNWSTPGALGQGTDVIAGKSFTLSGIQAVGGQTITVALDPAMVQSWVNNPAANQGILLVNESTGAVVRINASESVTVSQRPKLSVTYSSGTATPQPGALQLSNAAYSVNENGGSATITVTRSGGSDGAVSVNYATSNGSATSSNDYTATSGVLNFAGGEISKTFTIPITNDSAVEGRETINVTLSNPTGGATFGTQTTGVLTILDDDVPSPPPPVGTFTNVLASSGVGGIINQKYQETPNWWLSGEHLTDLDGDNDLDLYLSNHGGGSVVALNDGHGVFTRVTNGTFPDSEIHQIYDINEDGKIDVSMTYQDGGGRWWVNNSAAGAVNFAATNVTRETNTARAQVMLDFNGDGKVDWLRSAPPGLVVDFGNGSGGFTQNSLTFAVSNTTSNNNANFLPADFDDDGDIDLLVMTGGGYDNTNGRTALWRNNGNQTFTDITGTSGIPLDGVLAKGIGDYDQDGDTDFIAVENKSMPPTIYLNNGSGVFAKKAGAITGAGSGSLDYSAWGTAVSTDFDNDGIVDILMNGKYYLKILRGTGGGNFTTMNSAWGIKDTAAAAVDDGLSFGDIDNDGDLDIIGYDEIYPSRTLKVYRNDLAPQNFINVRPVGLAGNKGAAGAKISVFAAGTDQLLWYEQVATYDFQTATSYYGTSETERHFGLGNRATVDVVVEFAGGHTTRTNNVAANQTIRIVESAEGFRAAPRSAASGEERASAASSVATQQSSNSTQQFFAASTQSAQTLSRANAVDLALLELTLNQRASEANGTTRTRR